MQVVNISQRTDAWFEWRRAGITGTDAAVLLGLSKDKTKWQLWAEKLGKWKAPDLSGNPNVQRGIALEPIARQAIEDRLGVILLPFCGQHDEHEILRASFDGVDEDGYAVEIKCPGEKVWDSIMALRESAPEFLRYQVQVQHQILVSGKERAILVFYYEGQMMIFQIEKDQELCERILTESLSFWADLESGKEPEKDPLRDFFVPVGNAKAQWETIASERAVYAQELAALEARAKALKTDIKASEDKLVVLMGPFLRAEHSGLLISRYSQQGTVDWKTLIKDVLPDLELTEELLGKYRGAESNRVRVTETKTHAKKASKPRKKEKTEPEQKEETSSEVLPVNIGYAW